MFSTQTPQVSSLSGGEAHPGPHHGAWTVDAKLHSLVTPGCTWGLLGLFLSSVTLLSCRTRGASPALSVCCPLAAPQMQHQLPGGVAERQEPAGQRSQGHLGAAFSGGLAAAGQEDHGQ